MGRAGGYSPTLSDWVFILYFATHIPITLCIDLQAILPHTLYPTDLVALVQWYGNTFHDRFMLFPPAWFQSFIVCELLFQLPFFFVAIHGFYKGLNRIRVPCIIYGAHVSTTVIPILTEFVFADIPRSDKYFLLSVYSPYLLVPLALTFKMAFQEHPFGPNIAHRKAL
eukprot:Opistho-2@37072